MRILTFVVSLAIHEDANSASISADFAGLVDDINVETNGVIYGPHVVDATDVTDGITDLTLAEIRAMAEVAFGNMDSNQEEVPSDY